MALKVLEKILGMTTSGRHGLKIEPVMNALCQHRKFI
jgi:hypothetical protein